MPIDSVLTYAALIAMSYLLSFAIGLPIAGRLNGVRFPYLTAPIYGYAVIGVVATLLYKAGLSLSIIYSITCITAAAIFVAVSARAAKKDWLKKHCTAVNQLIVSGWFAATSLIVLPAWTGGLKYAIFQGNHWDQLSYITSAIVFAQEPYKSIAASGLEQYLQLPLLPIAAASLIGRPTVMVLFGTLGQIAPESMYKLGYAYEAFLLSMSFGAVLFMAANVFSVKGKLSTALGVLVSLAFVLGFWGQYIFDINAWSQVAAIPLTVLLSTHLLIILQRASTNLLHMALLCASLIYFYPEVMLFNWVVMAAFVAVLFLFASHRKAIIKPVASLARAAILGLVCSIPLFDSTIGYVARESPGARPEGWFRYFDGFYGGVSGGPPLAHNFNGISDSLAGLFGLYFLTPGHQWAPWLAMFDRAALLALCGSAVAASGGAIALARNRKAWRLSLFWVVAFLSCLGLGLSGSGWVAGKGISFVSPFLMLLLLSPLLTAVKKRQYWLLTPALIVLVAQLSFGIMRPITTRASAVMPYNGPYPVTQDPRIKEHYDWDVDRLKPQLDSFSLCQIDVSNPWLRHYLMLFLYNNRKEFQSKAPVCSYYLPDTQIGEHRVSGKPDCVIKLIDDNLALKNSDKRLTMDPVSSQ